MSILESQINASETRWDENATMMQSLIEKVNEAHAKSLFQGKEKHIQKAKEDQKFLARERIDLLLDEDSFFLEIQALIGLYGEGLGVGGTVVCGIGLVCGRLCMISANIGTLSGGAVDKATLDKSKRISEIAIQNHLPVINLVESSGANLQEQEKIFNFGGLIFREISRRSKKGIPTISVVFGNSTAGGAYIPGMSDYSIFVKDKAKVFLAGPPLVKMATNEIVDDERLGGATMHSTVSGVSDFLANDELDALYKARQIVKTWSHPSSVKAAHQTFKDPRYETAELDRIIPADITQFSDAREIIARFVDDSAFFEFKPDYGSSLVCGHAHIYGYKVAIIANNGILFSSAANKASHFIQLCNRHKTPIIYLQNTTGFMVGRAYEEAGIIKDGAKMLNAVSNSIVPTITIMIGASYGAGNYAMNGRAFEPRFLFSYPHAKLAVMGSKQLSGVMEIIQRAAAKKQGMSIDEEQAAQIRTFMLDKVERSSTALYSSSSGWDDGIIIPSQTRKILAICMMIIHNHQEELKEGYGIFRM